MQNVYTVAQVNAYIKNMFTQDFMMQSIFVKGEVSNCKYHSSGHIYFTLKDEKGSIACVMFAGNRAGLKFRMEEGQQVIVFGTIDVYERDGKYQMYARQIALDGAGVMYERFERLKEELEELGMFAPEYKQPIPRFIQKLGVVTAPTGAAVRDIINITTRRNPYVQIILYPAIVQGDQAAESIVNGIHALERLGVDVMIVGRGGGSIEDLWAFNERAVAQAVFDCSVPIISAVGHETDTMLIDYAADLRAPTPTGAAELAVPVKKDIYNTLLTADLRMQNAVTRYMNEFKQYVEALGRGIPPLEQLILENQQKIDDRNERLKLAFANLLKDKDNLLKLTNLKPFYIKNLLDAKKESLKNLALRLDSVSVESVLKRGFAWVSDGQFKTLYSTTQAKRCDELHIRFVDGIVKVKMMEKHNAVQGDLFDDL